MILIRRDYEEQKIIIIIIFNYYYEKIDDDDKVMHIAVLVCFCECIYCTVSFRKEIRR